MPAPTPDSPDEPFTWTSPEGVVITLPSLRRIKSGTLRRLRKEGEVELMYGVLEELADQATLALTDALDLDDLAVMFAMWQGAGASLGEASRSST